MDNINNNLDDHFKNLFENNDVPPPNRLWNKIDEQLDENFDQIFKSALIDNEVTPTPQVWNKVEKELPFNLFVRRQLQWLSKIAAVLVLVMLSTMLYNYHTSTKETTIISYTVKNIQKKELTLPLDKPLRTGDFVVGIKKEQKNKPNYSEKAANKQTNDDTQLLLDEFFADILSEEEDFEFNDKIIQEALKPLEQLPIEGVVASLPRKKASISSSNNVDIEIKIPLIVVEPSEVDNLLDVYDKNNKK